LPPGNNPNELVGSNDDVVVVVVVVVVDDDDDDDDDDDGNVVVVDKIDDDDDDDDDITLDRHYSMFLRSNVTISESFFWQDNHSLSK
jgi:hypothetical protein